MGPVGSADITPWDRPAADGQGPVRDPVRRALPDRLSQQWINPWPAHEIPDSPGRWAYLYRAIDEAGRTLDFHLSPSRSAKAAKRFLGNAVRACKAWEKPLSLTTDKAPTYPIAIAELKREGTCPAHVVHRRAKYLNNRIEADHGQLKRLIRPTLGFKSMRTAYATIKGFEVIRALKKGQAGLHQVQPGIRGEVRLVERAFGIGPDALTEMLTQLQTLNLAA